MNDKKKKIPVIKEPDDTVDTVYCSEQSDEYRNIMKNDVFPYLSPLPKYRRDPEPPII